MKKKDGAETLLEEINDGAKTIYRKNNDRDKTFMGMIRTILIKLLLNIPQQGYL